MLEGRAGFPAGWVFRRPGRDGTGQCFNPLQVRPARRWLARRLTTALLRVGPACPDWLGRMLGRAAGELAVRLRPNRVVLMEHVTLAFGAELDQAGLERLAAAWYRHLAATLFEILRLPAWNRERVLAVTTIDGLEQLDAAVAAGRGVIVLSGHVANWELGGPALAARGYPVTAVARTQELSDVDRFLAALRQRHGLSLIPKESPRGCFACLREGGILALAIDQWVREGGVSVPFFGHPAPSPTGPALLALKTGAPVFLFAGGRLPGGRFHGRLEPVAVTHTGNRERDIRENTARFQQALETAIRRHPEQWIWSYGRWRPQEARPRGKESRP